MKCPKCGYLGFEHAERCRNCSYDFSLTSSAAADLSLRGDVAMNPLEDLALVDAAMATRSTGEVSTLDLDRVFGAPEPAVSRPPAAEPMLFGSLMTPMIDDEPLITKASPPRPPLAVRKTPESARLRVEPPRPQSLDLALDFPSPAPKAETVSPAMRAAVQPWPGPAESDRAEDAAVGARVLAAAIDLTILAAIDALVVYFTMQICSLSLADLSLIPKGPLLAFLATQNFAYFVAFTAGGQTLGKMATGIRVIVSESRSSLDVSQASIRTLVWLVLAVPAGLGFVTAFFRHDHRGIHDRFAGTRVVRASA